MKLKVTYSLARGINFEGRKRVGSTDCIPTHHLNSPHNASVNNLQLNSTQNNATMKFDRKECCLGIHKVVGASIFAVASWTDIPTATAHSTCSQSYWNFSVSSLWIHLAEATRNHRFPGILDSLHIPGALEGYWKQLFTKWFKSFWISRCGDGQCNCINLSKMVHRSPESAEVLSKLVVKSFKFPDIAGDVKFSTRSFFEKSPKFSGKRRY